MGKQYELNLNSFAIVLKMVHWEILTERIKTCFPVQLCHLINYVTEKSFNFSVPKLIKKVK